MSSSGANQRCSEKLPELRQAQLTGRNAIDEDMCTLLQMHLSIYVANCTIHRRKLGLRVEIEISAPAFEGVVTEKGDSKNKKVSRLSWQST